MGQEDGNGRIRAVLLVFLFSCAFLSTGMRPAMASAASPFGDGANAALFQQMTQCGNDQTCINRVMRDMMRQARNGGSTPPGDSPAPVPGGFQPTTPGEAPPRGFQPPFPASNQAPPPPDTAGDGGPFPGDPSSRLGATGPMP